MAARWIVSAHTVATRHESQPRRDAELIEADEKDEDLGHGERLKNGEFKSLARVPERLIKKLGESLGIGSQSGLIAVVDDVDARAIVKHEVEFVAVVRTVFTLAEFGDDLQSVHAIEFGVVFQF